MMIHPAPKPSPLPPKAKKQPPKRNRKRHTREWIRAYGSEERVRWVKSFPCTVSDCPVGRIENAHIFGAGLSRKADASEIVPLCWYHHARLHQMGRRAFELNYSVDLKQAAVETEARWLSYINPKKESA